MATALPLPAATDVTADDLPGQWLIDQLHAAQREADRARRAALMASHPLPRPRASS